MIVMSATRNIVCPHCAATNRVPTARPAREARCGGCHGALFDGHPVAVDGARFARHRAANDIAVLVDVWAPWCGPCRTMAPMFERAAASLEPEVRLLKLNADEEQQVSAEYGISGIPALLLFRGGELIARTAGAMDANRIVAWTRQQLAAA
jgi:thioredoxin 2